MARDEKNLKEMFLADAKKTADLLRAGRVRLNGGQAGADELDAAFRAVHSIKSEAGFLGFSELAGLAGRVEDALSRARSSNGAAGEESAAAVDRLERMLSDLIRQSRPKPQPGAAAEMSEFEKTLVREAVRRGERLYLVSCCVGRQESMPYARLYLVLNNLELAANVIHTRPSLEILSEGRDYALEMVISSSRPLEELHAMLAVDALEQFSIEPRPAGDFLPGEGREEGGGPAQSPYRSLAIEYPSSISMARTTAQEALLLAALGRKLFAESAGPAKDDPGLKAVLDGQAQIWGDVSGVSVAWLVQKLEGVIADLNARAGKSVRLSCSGELKARLPFETFGGLADSLVQLVRNAHDHGIENADERRRAGKRQNGQISVSFTLQPPAWLVTVRDDGRGIDREKVFEHARQTGLDVPAGADLLEVLVRPGFSTAPARGGVSGRGVGLDIVKHAVVAVLGGRLALETEADRGSVFSLSFDPAASRCRVIPILAGNSRLLIPDFMLREFTAWDAGRLKEEKDRLWYSMRDVQVLVHPDYLADIPAARYAVIIQRRGELLALPAMELLKETYLSREEILESAFRNILGA